MDARRFGLLVALAGLLALAGLFANDPPPGSFEQWACCGTSPDSWLLIARGPAISRYDEVNDTTFAVFECGHAYCDFAARIPGDAREDVARENVLLFSSYRPTPGGIAQMAEPIGIQGSAFGGGGVVANATIEPLEIASPWLHLGLYAGAFLLVAMGGAIAWGAGAWERGMTLAGAASGLAWGAMLVRAPELIVGPIMAILLGGLGLAAALAGRRWTRARRAAFALLFASAALSFALVTFDAFIAHDPLR